MTPRLWVIDPSENHPEREGVAEIVAGWPGSWKLFQPALAGDGPTPADGYDVDAVVLMGSAASVHDEIPWMRTLSSWLAPIVRGSVNRPLLGICFGHQLIAHLAGAEVRYLTENREKRVGVEVTSVAGWRLDPGPRVRRVVVSHREHVTACPAQFRIVASRPGVAVDGLEHSRLPISSFQFHPEARGDFARTAGFDPSLIDRCLREDSRAILDRFLAAAASSVVRLEP